MDSLEYFGSAKCTKDLSRKVLDLKKEQTKDVVEVAERTEQILRILTFSLLEVVIQEEEADGDLVLSSLPETILSELRDTKRHFCNTDVTSEGTAFDRAVLKDVVETLKKQLANIAKHFHSKFHKLVMLLNSSNSDVMYEQFVAVCKRIRGKEEISWGHIASLLVFCAEITVQFIKLGNSGLEEYMERVVHYLVEYFIKEEIAEWIATHGGWVAMVDVFDQPGCKDHATHLLSVMTLSELTHVEVWVERVVIGMVVVGACYTVVRWYFN